MPFGDQIRVLGRARRAVLDHLTANVEVAGGMLRVGDGHGDTEIGLDVAIIAVVEHGIRLDHVGLLADPHGAPRRGGSWYERKGGVPNRSMYSRAMASIPRGGECGVD